MCFLQAALGLEKVGLPPTAAGLGVLVIALVVLDTFNQSVLGEGTLNNPVNSIGFAAAGQGPFVSHLCRIVSRLLYLALRRAVLPEYQTLLDLN